MDLIRTYCTRVAHVYRTYEGTVDCWVITAAFYFGYILILYSWSQLGKAAVDQCQIRTDTEHWSLMHFAFEMFYFSLISFAPSYLGDSPIANLSIFSISFSLDIDATLGSIVLFWQSYCPELFVDCSESETSMIWISKFWFSVFFFWRFSVLIGSIHQKSSDSYEPISEIIWTWFDRKKRANVLQQLIRNAGTKEGCILIATEYCGEVLKYKNCFEDKLVRYHLYLAASSVFRSAPVETEQVKCKACEQELMLFDKIADLRAMGSERLVWHEECFARLTSGQMLASFDEHYYGRTHPTALQSRVLMTDLVNVLERKHASVAHSHSINHKARKSD
jgi:hypothetical protein